MSKENIWRFLKHKGFSDIAAAAIMGNMEAESGCISYRLQGDFGKNFQRSNPEAVDMGSASGRILREKPGYMIWHWNRGFPSGTNSCRWNI